MKVASEQIVIPHEAEVRTLSAVKYMVLQTSLLALQQGPHFANYTGLVEPAVLAAIQAGLASEWAPMELADAHYTACEGLGLSTSELSNNGRRVGGRLRETALVTAAKKNRGPAFDAWSEVGSMHRMWGRLYKGGSAMVAKLGPKESLLEMRGFTLNRYRYYRYSQLASIEATFSALAVQVQSIKIAHYSPVDHELQVRIVWE